MVWSKWVKNSLPAILSMHLTPVVVQFSVGSARQSGDPPTICVAMLRCLAMPKKRDVQFRKEILKKAIICCVTSYMGVGYTCGLQRQRLVRTSVFACRILNCKRCHLNRGSDIVTAVSMSTFSKKTVSRTIQRGPGWRGIGLSHLKKPLKGGSLM